MQKIKTAVIGVGYLGRFHAQKYRKLKIPDFFVVVIINLGIPGQGREEVAGMAFNVSNRNRRG